MSCFKALSVVILFAPLMETAYCPDSKRYDISGFPPRCIDCPRITANRMPLEQITAVTRSKRAPKFSPGLPQNDTCGCWRGNSTVEVMLNASWIVSGLTFDTTRQQWLRRISIQASDDNRTFLDWGNYTSQNHTAAAMIIFPYPVRARLFRIRVLQYVNHYLNATAGFPLTAGALVSHVQPFTCDCPQLSSGTCCPFINMTVRNDTCVWCTDPTLLSTVMVNGCGQCKKGFFEHQGQCVLQRLAGVANNIEIHATRSNGVYWTVDFDLTLDSQTEAQMYLTGCGPTESNCTNITILQYSIGYIPSVSIQYLQFDRGRGGLNMTQQTIRAWATCQGAVCSGSLVVQFTRQGKVWQVLSQPLTFRFGVPTLLGLLAGTRSTALAHIEIHYFADQRVWALRVLGVQLISDRILVNWGGGWANATDARGEYIHIPPPPPSWDSLRVTDGITSLQANPPLTAITHGETTRAEHSGIIVNILYGLGLAQQPSAGDSEQIVLITAQSPQPIRLKRLATTLGGISVIYTSSKGFILDPQRVLDLSIACAQRKEALQSWIAQAIGILMDSMPDLVSRYIDQCCSYSGSVSRAYWMVPTHATLRRDASVPMQVAAEFS